MQRFMLLGLLSLLALQSNIYAQAPVTSKTTTLSANLGNYNEECYLKGWYLYWPAEALQQPRLPLPYPWWPAQARRGVPAQQGNPAPAEESPRPGANIPPGQLPLPTENQALPPLPKSSSSYYPGNRPVVPVSYPQVVPSYWYGR
jgi:hypothetical protein